MQLQEYFQTCPRAALAFSGGVDSACLLYAARQAGADITAYYVQSAFQPRFEQEDARRLAEELNVPLKVLTVDILCVPAVTANPPDRCYFCKRQIFSAILAAAETDGYRVVLDGTNASDDAGDRPGMRALRELSIRSPLRECGLTKEEIRKMSREAGLFTWNKPAYACLATRIPTGETITAEKLARTEAAEEYLRARGFTDFRIRLYHGAARMQLPENQMEKLLAQREEILTGLKQWYPAVFLDLEARS